MGNMKVSSSFLYNIFAYVHYLLQLTAESLINQKSTKKVTKGNQQIFLSLTL